LSIEVRCFHYTNPTETVKEGKVERYSDFSDALVVNLWNNPRPKHESVYGKFSEAPVASAFCTYL
jgi:hypothetical protein